MKNNQEYITELCQILFSQGKNPTVALLRSHANRPLFIPDVIKGLQRWKQNPQALGNVELSKNKTTPATQQTLTERVQQLEDQVAELSVQLKALQQNKN